MGNSKKLNKALKEYNATRERINKESDKLVQEEILKAAERMAAEERKAQTVIDKEKTAKAEAVAQALHEYDKTIDYYDKIEVVKMEKGKVFARCVKGGLEIKTKKFKSLTKANEWKTMHIRPIR